MHTCIYNYITKLKFVIKSYTLEKIPVHAQNAQIYKYLLQSFPFQQNFRVLTGFFKKRSV